MKVVKKLIVASMIIGAATCYGGTPCETVVSTSDTLQQATALSVKVLEQLNNTDNKVVLLARAGQDLSKYNLNFSHLGFVVRNHPSGKWSVVHELNICGTNKSQLFVQGLTNFYADDMFKYEAGLVYLPMEIQDKLERILVSNEQIKKLHEEKYSAVAYPFSTIYQNSNQWVLETFTMAATNTTITKREDAQEWLRSVNYNPTLLNIPTFTRLGGRMFKANIAFDDHPDEYRYKDKIYAVTVESVFDLITKLYPNDSKILILK